MAVLAGIAYLGFAANRVTTIGAGAWALAVLLAVLAFWQRREPRRQTTHSSGSRVGTTVWALGGALVVGACFRFAQLDAIPGEMTSDHVEKLLDVQRVLAGTWPVFFAGNGGREPLQFYLTAMVAWGLPAELTHLILKLPMAAVGSLTIPLIYLLGREASASRRVGFLAAYLFAVGWWPVVASRVGLRFPLAPLFTSLSLWLVLRGLRRRRHNALVLSGVVLGIGLFSYTPMRVVPLVIVLAVALHLWRRWSPGAWTVAARRVAMIALICGVVALPLARVAVDMPAAFWQRTLTRVTAVEQPYAASLPLLVVRNAWHSAGMFSWKSANAWIMGPPEEPALDWLTAIWFHAGLLLLVLRMVTWPRWTEQMLVLSLPLLLLPTALALAFPVEVPSLNRAVCAQPVVFVIAAVGLQWTLRRLQYLLPVRSTAVVWAVAAALLLGITWLNFRIVFERYPEQYRRQAQNHTEVAAVVRDFVARGGQWEGIWIWSFPHWVDARAIGIAAGRMGWANVIDSGADACLRASVTSGPLLVLVHRTDLAAVQTLQRLYPHGTLRLESSGVSPDKAFFAFEVPAAGART